MDSDHITGENVFTKAGSTKLNRMLLPRHMMQKKHGNSENKWQQGASSANGVLATSLKLLNVATHEAILTGVSTDAYFSKGGDTGQVHREYRNGVKENIANLFLNDDEFMKVCWVAWKSITKGRRLNDRQQQLDRFTAIMETKMELDSKLKPEKLKRRGTIMLYSHLDTTRMSLLRSNFEFWRDISGLMRRKLAKYFDRWNVWNSEFKLRKMTATRFCEIIKSTELLRWNRRQFKKLVFEKWLNVGSYLVDMRIVSLLFRAWKTETEGSERQRRLRIKVALGEWHFLAMETAARARKAVASRRSRLLGTIWSHWVTHRANRLAKKDSLARINNSNLSKISSVSASDTIAASDSGIAAGSEAQHGHDISGMTMSTMSDAVNISTEREGKSGNKSDVIADGSGGSESRDVSVLQQSLSEEPAGLGRQEQGQGQGQERPIPPPKNGAGALAEGQNATPERGISNGGHLRGKHPVVAPGSSGSRDRARKSVLRGGRAQVKAVPAAPPISASTSLHASREAMWELRLQNLKSLDLSFQEDSRSRLRSSGL